MKFIIKREDLLKPLQSVIGVVERRQTMPILANVLIVVQNGQLYTMASDLEIELLSSVPMHNAPSTTWATTVSGRKLIDICRALPAESDLELEEKGPLLSINAGNCRFNLATLPANEFPQTKEDVEGSTFSIPQKHLLSLVKRTHFAIADNHAHRYLNGMLLHIEQNTITAVASDGHRMSRYAIMGIANADAALRIIVPRKGVGELLRLLSDIEDPAKIEVTKNYIRVITSEFTFTSKLIDSKYPDYHKLIPQGGTKRIVLNCEDFRRALARIGILSNEILRSMHLELCTNLLRMTTNNAEQEKAEEVLPVEYDGDILDIGFNITYLMDILATIKSKYIAITFKNSKSGAVIEEVEGKENCLYVIMPFQI